MITTSFFISKPTENIKKFFYTALARHSSLHKNLRKQTRTQSLRVLGDRRLGTRVVGAMEKFGVPPGGGGGYFL